MLEEMVRAVIRKTVAADYPHLKVPAVVYARVVSVRPAGDWLEYRLTVLDRFGNPDETFPGLPQVRSKKSFREETVISVAFPYGELTPVILEEVYL
jgi:hypothetical protein